MFSWFIEFFKGDDDNDPNSFSSSDAKSDEFNNESSMNDDFNSEDAYDNDDFDVSEFLTGDDQNASFKMTDDYNDDEPKEMPIAYQQSFYDFLLKFSVFPVFSVVKS